MATHAYARHPVCMFNSVNPRPSHPRATIQKNCKTPPSSVCSFSTGNCPTPPLHHTEKLQNAPLVSQYQSARPNETTDPLFCCSTPSLSYRKIATSWVSLEILPSSVCSSGVWKRKTTPPRHHTEKLRLSPAGEIASDISLLVWLCDPRARSSPPSPVCSSGRGLMSNRWTRSHRHVHEIGNHRHDQADVSSCPGCSYGRFTCPPVCPVCDWPEICTNSVLLASLLNNSGRFFGRWRGWS